MTAWDLVQQYIQKFGSLPPVGNEYNEIADYVEISGWFIDTPEADSIIAVCQMLRQRQAEALQAAGQMVLL